MESDMELYNRLRATQDKLEEYWERTKPGSVFLNNSGHIVIVSTSDQPIDVRLVDVQLKG